MVNRNKRIFSTSILSPLIQLQPDTSSSPVVSLMDHYDPHLSSCNCIFFTLLYLFTSNDAAEDKTFFVGVCVEKLGVSTAISCVVSVVG